MAFTRIANFFTNRDKKASPTETIGVTGAQVTGGYVVNHEKNIKLSRSMRYQSYIESMNIPIVSAGVNYYFGLIANSTWDVQPSENDISEEVADFLRENMFNMNTPWSVAIRRASTYKLYGFSVQEWTMERRKNRLFMKDLDVRPQKTIEKWDIDQSGNVLGCVQSSPISGEEYYLPRDKILYLVDNTKDDSPEGRGLFRDIFPIAQKWDAISKQETFGYQTDLRGIPIAYAPYLELIARIRSGELTEDEVKQILGPLEQFTNNIVRNNAQMSVSLDSRPYQSTTDNGGNNFSSQKMFSVELLQGNGAGLSEVDTAIKRLNQELAMVLGVENLLLGSGGGSEALSRDKSKELSLRIDGVLEDIRQQLQKDYVAPLMRANGIAEELWPEIMVSKQRYQDVESISRTLRDMAMAVTPDDPANNYIRSLMGVPELDIDDIEIESSLMGDLPDGNSDN